MKIIVDAFGGDNAPLEILRGCEAAAAEYGAKIILTGNGKKIRECAAQNGISLGGMEIAEAPDVISVEDDPMSILKTKRQTSMGCGLWLLREGKGDAFVSAGSTAALVVGGSAIVGRLSGVSRAALASVMPGEKKGFLLLDIGANAVCRPDMLLSFGIMGSVYMEKVLDRSSPAVALINIGAEENKGTKLQTDAFQLLKNSTLNFQGNIEPRDIPSSDVDVMVCDGFTGNVVLKLMEGVALSFVRSLKDIFKKSMVSKLAALLISNGLRGFKTRLDYSEYGGAPLLGLKLPVIKAHGSSDANSFKNAIRQAIGCVESGMTHKIQAELALVSPPESDGEDSVG